METRLLGPTGIRVPVVGQGTWHMERDRSAAIRALRHGLDLGLSHIDTAEMYGSGEVETLVGDAIEGRRDEVFLVSKVLPGHADYKGTLRACERSLKHLNTDRLDLYLLHWPGNIPLEETIRAFEKLRRDGKIRAYGVSNFGLEELAQAIAIAGEGKIACNQMRYHLKERAIENGVLPFCEENKIAVVAHSPFGQNDFPDDDETLASVAETRSATPRQIALRFLLRHEHVFVIPKASAVEHVMDNAEAGRLALPRRDLVRIDRAFPLGT